MTERQALDLSFGSVEELIGVPLHTHSKGAFVPEYTTKEGELRWDIRLQTCQVAVDAVKQVLGHSVRRNLTPGEIQAVAHHAADTLQPFGRQVQMANALRESAHQTFRLAQADTPDTKRARTA